MTVSGVLGLAVNVRIEVLDAHGLRLGPDGWPTNKQVRQTIEGRNRFPVGGLNWLRDQLDERLDRASITHMAIGDGTTATTALDTELEAELYRAPVTRCDRAVDAQALVQLFIPSSILNGADLQEFGLFSEDTLVARYVRPSPIAKDATMALAVSWAVVFTSISV